MLLSEAETNNGERSSPLEGAEHLTPLHALRARNLLLATWIGEIYCS